MSKPKVNSTFELLRKSTLKMFNYYYDYMITMIMMMMVMMIIIIIKCSSGGSSISSSNSSSSSSYFSSSRSSSGRFLSVESQDHKTAIICVNSDSYIIIFLILALALTYVFVSFDYQQPHYYVGDSGRCTRDDCGDGSTLSLPQETNKRPWVDSHTTR